MVLSLRASKASAAVAATSAPLLALGLAAPALAHHPLGMAEGAELSPWQGLLSGIGHPLLGPDHLLFLLAIAFAGLSRPRAWVLPLLAAGLLGSGLVQLVPLPDGMVHGAEVLVALSLAMAGLVTLGVLPTWLLLPAIALHGALLGGTVVGAEPTPLVTYLLGLLLSQGALLLLVTGLSGNMVRLLGDGGRRIAAGIWIGLGIAFGGTLLLS
jgi:urease accessory protein